MSQSPDGVGIKENTGQGFEHTHVQQVYDEIAPHVNHIQHKAWPNVKRFLKRFKPGSLVADIGCGNGRYLGINDSIFKVGLDVCCPLVDNSRTKGHEVLYADNLHVPFRSGVFDGVISIGVIHHFCSLERRIQAMKELSRILLPGGRMMVYVWAYEQKHRKFDCQDVLVPWHGGSSNRNKAETGSRSRLSSFSSVSSVSEDDSSGSTEQLNTSQTANKRLKSTNNSDQSNGHSIDSLQKLKGLRRKSSSFEICENGSPGSAAHRRSEVVRECRRIEASLRALSMGCLNNTDAATSVKVKGQGCLCKVKSLGCLQSRCPTSLKESISENGADLLGRKLVTLSGRSAIGDFTKLHTIEDDDQHIVDDVFDNSSQKVRPGSTMDPACLDLQYNGSDTLSVYTSPSENIDEAIDIKQDLGQQCVEEELDRKAEEKQQSEVKPEKQSFFKSIKTKFLKIFDSDSDDEMDNSHTSPRKTVLRKRRTDPRQNFKQPLFSLDSLPSEAHLDFAVREFPQSSWPKLHSSPETETVTEKNGHVQNDSNGHGESSVKLKSADQREIDRHRSLHLLSLSEERVKSIHQNFSSHQNYSSCSEYQSALESESKSSRSFHEPGAVDAQHNVKRSDRDKNNKLSNHKHNDNLAKRIESDYTGKTACYETARERVEANACEKTLRRNRDSVKDSRDTYTEISSTDSVVSKSIDLNDTEKTDNSSSHIVHPESMAHVSCVGGEGAKDKSDLRLCRYYHVFKENELQDLILTHVKDVSVVQCFYDHANWCIIAEKL